MLKNLKIFSLILSLLIAGLFLYFFKVGQDKNTQNEDLIEISKPLIVFDGNSLTEGYSVRTSLTYPFQVQDLLGQDFIYRNFGVGGQTTEMMSADASIQIDTLINPLRKSNILIAWEITNDLYFGRDAVDAYNNFVKYCQDRRHAGWKVVVLSILPRSNEGTPLSFNRDYQQINMLLHRNWPGFADELADIAEDSRLGSAGAELNQEYFLSDRAHLNGKGYSIVSQKVKSAIQNIIKKS